jgi:recombination protein RecA
MAKKDDHVANVIGAMEQKFKGASVRRLAEGSRSAMKEVIPTGLDVLDNWIFGVGGIPGNRIGEVFGNPDSGKTSLGFAFLAAAQRAGGMAVLWETEGTLDTNRAPIFGCDMDNVVLAEPDTADDVVEQIKELVDIIPNGVGPNIIVWDSLASAQSEAAHAGKGDIGNRARLMSKELPIIQKKLAEKRTAIVVINQIRMKVGVMFGSPETTPGGETLKYMASWRLQLWRGTAIKKGSDEIGQNTTIKAVKNKVCHPHRKSVFKLDFNEGWDNTWSTVDFAKERGAIPNSTKQSKKAYELASKNLQNLEGWYNGKEKAA